jgi:dTDP-4-amino-4,6-dideoxygalactose transaminase
MQPNDSTWRDRLGDFDGAADALDKVQHRAPVLSDAAETLRVRYQGDAAQLAADVADHGYYVARKFGAYDDAGVLADAADALADLAEHGDDSTIVRELPAFATDPQA